MNFVFISPNFPVRYFKWVEALKNHGVNVLGIGDTPYYNCHERLKKALKEYYYVPDMNDFEAMKAAISYYVSKYGKIDFIESDNEWWLTLDARLRQEFGINTGFLPYQMEAIKAKSAMKEYFVKGGAKVSRYILVDGPADLEKAKEFIKTVGYPVFVKPNVGVGASDSFKIKDEEALNTFLSKQLIETYIMEEFIEGFIVSYDGVCDIDSNVVFATSDHFPTPIDQIVHDAMDIIYYNNPFSLPFHDIDGEAFEKLGRSVVKAFGISKRFFHIEFFVLTKDKEGLGKKGQFIGLECNMRPPGGYTPDLIDYANSISCYELYADVICYNESRQDLNKEKFYAFAVSRRNGVDYVHSEKEIDEKYGSVICMKGRYPAHIAVAMGDNYFYARFKDFKEGEEFASFLSARKA